MFSAAAALLRWSRCRSVDAVPYVRRMVSACGIPTVPLSVCMAPRSSTVKEINDLSLADEKVWVLMKQGVRRYYTFMASDDDQHFGTFHKNFPRPTKDEHTYLLHHWPRCPIDHGRHSVDYHPVWQAFTEGICESVLGSSRAVTSGSAGPD